MFLQPFGILIQDIRVQRLVILMQLFCGAPCRDRNWYAVLPLTGRAIPPRLRPRSLPQC
jgi:hypothetical protein